MLGREDAIGHPALTDRPTGLANRLHFELVHSYLFGAGDRGVTLTILLISIGTSEMETGDPGGLRTIGAKLQETTRTSDLAGHLGHGRFAVLLLGTNLQGGRITADRVESALAEIAPLSIGLAAYGVDMKESSDLLQPSPLVADTACECVDDMRVLTQATE